MQWRAMVSRSDTQWQWPDYTFASTFFLSSGAFNGIHKKAKKKEIIKKQNKNCRPLFQILNSLEVCSRWFFCKRKKTKKCFILTTSSSEFHKLRGGKKNNTSGQVIVKEVLFFSLSFSLHKRIKHSGRFERKKRETKNKKKQIQRESWVCYTYFSCSWPHVNRNFEFSSVGVEIFWLYGEPCIECV